MSKFNRPGAGPWPEGDGWADSLAEQRWRRILTEFGRTVQPHPEKLAWFEYLSRGRCSHLPANEYTPDFLADEDRCEVKPYYDVEHALSYADRGLSITGGLVMLGNPGRMADLGHVPVKVFGAKYIHNRPTVAMVRPWSLNPLTSLTGVQFARVERGGIVWVNGWTLELLADVFYEGTIPPTLWLAYGILKEQWRVMKKYKGWRPQYPPEAA